MKQSHQPKFFIGQEIIFQSDGYSAAVTILSSEWDNDAEDWHYRYAANNEHDGWFYQSNVTHFVRVNKDWESVESQVANESVYAI